MWRLRGLRCVPPSFTNRPKRAQPPRHWHGYALDAGVVRSEGGLSHDCLLGRLRAPFSFPAEEQFDAVTGAVRNHSFGPPVCWYATVDKDELNANRLFRYPVSAGTRRYDRSGRVCLREAQARRERRQSGCEEAPAGRRRVADHGGHCRAAQGLALFTGGRIARPPAPALLSSTSYRPCRRASASTSAAGSTTPIAKVTAIEQHRAIVTAEVDQERRDQL